MGLEAELGIVSGKGLSNLLKGEISFESLVEKRSSTAQREN